MQAAQNLGKDRGHRRGNHARSCSMGHRLRVWSRSVWGRGIKRAAKLGLEVIHRETLCFVIAMIFSAVVVIPGILIFYDRTLPFELIDSRMVETTASPGQQVDVRYTVRNLSKSCDGYVDRFFFDASGRAFYLGTSRIVYSRLLDPNKPTGSFDRQWRIPESAASGPGVYVADPKFWCYPLQHLYPVRGASQKTPITVVRSGR